MNKFLQISNIILIAAVALLFLMFFRDKDSSKQNYRKQTKKVSTLMDSANRNQAKMAYFELDSVEAKYKYYNEVKNDLIAREKEVQNTLNGLQKRFENRLKSAQEKGAAMSQNEQASIQKELENMQTEYAKKERNMREDLIMERLKKLQGVNERIQKIAKEIAEAQGYDYVLSRYESGENNIIYYSNTDFDITSELIEKLNAQKSNAPDKK